MALLGIDFIISSLLLFSGIFIFVFIFRKRIRKFFYRESPIDIFVENLKQYVTETYPKIVFDFSFVEESIIEKDGLTRKYLIAENIISQYSNITLNPENYPDTTPPKLQWNNYIFNSTPHKKRLPADWEQRKIALLDRDNKECFRCSKKIHTGSTQIHMIRTLEDGGKYNLENLVPICRDCEKILSEDSKKMHHLDIKDNLYDLVKNN